MYSLEVVSEPARLAELEGEWNALADGLGSPLLRHDWFMACTRAFAAGSRLAVHLVRDGEGRLRAVAPLRHERSHGVMRLQMLSRETYEPDAFLYDDEDALAVLCEAVVRQGRPVVLRRIGNDSRELALLQAAQRRRGLPVLRPGSTATYSNPLAADWKAIEASMSSKQKSELRRRRKKLEELGAVAFEALAPDEATFEAALAAFFEVEGTGWKQRNGTSLLQDHRARGFYTDYALSAARQGLLRLFFLRLDGRVVAGQLHVAFGGRLWALKIGYDEALSKHAPGALLTHEVLRHGCEHGLHAFEHLGEAEEWQRRWPVEVRHYTTLRLYPISAGGGAALTLDTLDFVHRRARKRAAADEPRSKVKEPLAA